MVFLFCPIRPPSSRESATNDISFKSPDIGLLEFKKKLGVASPGGATAQLTKKAPPSLKLVWSLSEPRYSNFHSKFQYLLLRAFQKGIIAFPRSTGCKMAGRQSLKCKTRVRKRSTLLYKLRENGSSFHTPNFDDLPFYNQLTQEKVLYLFGKPWVIAIGIWNENWSI